FSERDGYDESIEEMVSALRGMGMRMIPDDLERAGQQEASPFCVFLCHSGADKETISEEVIKTFKRFGISYWVDHEQIGFDDRSIIAKIEDGLRNSKFVLLCTSKNFTESSWCRDEYAAILHRSRGDASRLIPLSLDGSKSSIPLLLSDKMQANLKDQ